MTRLLILIPAAGQSSRMRGDDKLLRMVDGQPLLTRQVARARGTGQKVLVTLPHDRPARRRTLAAAPRVTLTDIDGTQGMSASLRAGAAACLGEPALAGLLIALPDMPDITTADMNRLIACFVGAPDRVCRAATPDGRAGHPVILPRRLCPAIAALTGDTGAKAILTAEDADLIALPDDRALRDLDTPEDWQAWEARQR
ncbi:nucleotidyltransferase family protein [Actibacterium ureilyticum]|uniref:nucleotidyltransferase family protein n=1 Tax=Actibacterium ureilyticum TaxID=1590614 RepID=UPI000BAB10A9|nr:nucleotidyltransferase family protein [Actibacterium ureilyticum]